MFTRFGSVVLCVGIFVAVLFECPDPVSLCVVLGVVVVDVIVVELFFPRTMYVGVTVFSVVLTFPLEITASGSVIDTMGIEIRKIRND